MRRAGLSASAELLVAIMVRRIEIQRFFHATSYANVAVVYHIGHDNYWY